ncbi:glycosyltransferase family 39 protein [Asanoa sp. WMMD1127]|uniref:glycosyltransferase family 39 protein n=1 Tax=Asanoa sp. WMMD1127 TaxID=3016107 RepID=UPI002417622C|nr:glycosyltransferase family 39 protein [Asanoa sp. WMMD1127]MDG4823050.1 glycosyltransferase family 39 protein [Asanoa sp. WMMD1127]
MTQQLDRARLAVDVRRRARPWAPLAPAVLTVLIVGVQLGRAPLWRDELATWSAAGRPLPDLWRMLGGIDAVSGPYYVFLHGWIALFGDSVVALRLPSLLAMAGAAALTTQLGTRLFGARAGLVAGLLFAVVPSTSRYGQEARGYAFAALFAVLATLLLVRAVDRPTGWRFVGYGLALLGLGLCNVVGLLVVAGHAAAAIGIRRAVIGFAATVGTVAVLLSPLLWRGRGQQDAQLNWVPKPGLADLVDLPGSVLQAAAVGGALIVLAAVGWALTRGRWPTVLALSVMLPALLLFTAGRLAPFWVPRYLLFTVSLLCVLAAIGVTRLRLAHALALVAVIAVLGAPAQVGLRRTHEWPRTAPVDYPAAVAVIGANAQPGDGIVYEPRAGWRMLDVAVARGLGGAAPRDVLVRQTAIERGELRATECGDPAACLAAAGADRLWLLSDGDLANPLAAVPGEKGAALRAAYTTRQIWHEPGLTVALLTSR